MTYKIALNFEDGVTRFIEARPGDTLADASYRVGINIPLDCRDGACGTCKGRCESGKYDNGSYIEDAMTEEEAAEGYILACQMKPQSDCVVQIAASSDVCRTKIASYNAQLSEVRKASDSTICFSLKLPEGAPLGFLPGQYVNILVPDSEQKRSYSFSSPPDSAELSFLVRNIPKGLMSKFLREKAAPGVGVEFSGPVGSFYLREIKRPLLFLAGGTGLAPFLSMLGKIRKDGSPHPVHMIYGVTNDADLVEVDKLEGYAKVIPNFTFSCCVADEGSAHPQKGYVTRYIEPQHVNDGDVDVYLCGPPAMVDAVRHYLDDKGIQPSNFYFEKFSTSGAVTSHGETHRR